MVKASLKTLSDVQPKDIVSILSSEFSGEIEHLDFRSNAPVVPSTLWVNRIFSVLTTSYNKINQIFDTYLHYLDVGLVDKILKFKQGEIVNLIKNSVVMIPQTINQYDYFPIFNSNRKVIISDLRLLSSIIGKLHQYKALDLLNELTSMFWNPSYGTILGSSRVNNLKDVRVFPGVPILDKREIKT